MSGLGIPEVMVLLVAAVILFGPEKLPELARKAARVISYVRNIANNAQTQISSELGPEFKDFDIRDPRGSIRRHLMDQVDPIMSDVKEEIADTKKMFDDTGEDLADIRGELDELGADFNELARGDDDDVEPAAEPEPQTEIGSEAESEGESSEAESEGEAESSEAELESARRRPPFDVDAT